MSFPLWFNALPSGHTQGSRQGYLTPLGRGLPLLQALSGDPAPRGLGWWQLDLLKPQWWPHPSKPRWRQPHDLWITSGSFFSFLEEKCAFAARWCSHVESTRSNSLPSFHLFFSMPGLGSISAGIIPSLSLPDSLWGCGLNFPFISILTLSNGVSATPLVFSLEYVLLTFWCKPFFLARGIFKKINLF